MSRRRPALSYRLMMGLMGPFEYWLNLTCKSFIRLASEKYERPLTTGERVRQAIHRVMCGICRVQERRLEQIRALTLEIGRVSLEDTNIQLSPEARDRIRNALIDAGGQ